MAVRPIDGYELLGIELLLDTDVVRKSKTASWLLDQVLHDIQAMPTLTPPPITGDTSDGYHTFNELYHHRAVLFSVICNARPDIAWKSKKHHDGTMYDGMFIVGIDTPEGQATYHYDIKPYWRMFRVKELEFAPKWDGHTPDEAIRRIGTLTQPNEPLTLDELREMDGEPVWVEEVEHWALIDIEKSGQWARIPFAVWAENGAKRSDIVTALAYGMKDCELCKNSQCYVRGGTKPCLPKWRGQKEG